MVGDHMSDTVISAAPDWSLERAAIEMSRQRHIRHLVVVDGGEIAGVLSMRDIMRVWTSEGATSAMTSPGRGSGLAPAPAGDASSRASSAARREARPTSRAGAAAGGYVAVLGGGTRRTRREQHKAPDRPRGPSR